MLENFDLLFKEELYTNYIERRQQFDDKNNVSTLTFCAKFATHDLLERLRNVRFRKRGNFENAECY